LGGIMHASVYRRFDGERVRLTGGYGAYRPIPLRKHVDFARFSEKDAPFPADSYEGQRNLAGEPPRFPA
jgi:hypothetical protein